MKNSIPKVIAIDGHSSTGKSSLAKKLAKALGYIHIDTGAMYRAITLFAIQNDWIDDNGELNVEELIAGLKKINLNFIENPSTQENEITLNGCNVENGIRSMEVSSHVSEVAKVSEVREMLVQIQRNLAQETGIVMDGRDIGTVVFPDALVKIFLTASAEVRAKRRFDELTKKGVTISLEEVQKNVNERDFIDSHRANSPLKASKDAVIINNDKLNREETFDAVMEVVKQKLLDV